MATVTKQELCSTCGVVELEIRWESTATGLRPGVRIYPTPDSMTHVLACELAAQVAAEQSDPDPDPVV